MAHPITKKYKNIKAIAKKFNNYLKDAMDKGSYPIIKEFCLKNGYSYDYIMELKRELPKLEGEENKERREAGILLAQSLKNIIDWQEVILERMLISGNGSPAGIIFKLKQHQHGWTDRQQIEHSATDDLVKMIEAKNKMIKDAINNSDL